MNRRRRSCPFRAAPTVGVMRRGAGATSALALAFALTGCTQCGGNPARGSVEPMVFGLQARLKPEHGAVTRYSGLRWDRSGVHASWEVVSGMEWTAYAAWVAGRMPADFRADPSSSGPSRLLFRKSAEADFYVLRLEPLASASPARVRVTFDGHPN